MIKSIQIRSFVKGGNHGQYLQALGLAELVKKLLPNVEVTHVDYENHFWKELKIQTYGGMLPKFLVMRYYWIKNLKFSPLKHSAEVSIYGSDMIWHLDSDLFLPDRIFFGEQDRSKYKISYAPSAGYRINNEPRWITELLSQFKAVGVRDKNTANLVKDHSENEPVYVIDPCFHLLDSDYSSWFLNQEKQNYISIYSPLTNELVNAFYANLDLSLLPHYISRFQFYGYFPKKRFLSDLAKQITNPLWTVQQIAKSRLLITSTFHGIMMALMTGTPFIAAISPNLLARLNSPIAKSFSAKRLMTLEEISSLTNKQIEYFMSGSDIDISQLNAYIDQSKIWLSNTLDSVTQG